MSAGQCCLGRCGKFLLFPEQVGVPFMLHLLWSWGTTPEDWKWRAVDLLCFPSTAFLLPELQAELSQLLCLCCPSCLYQAAPQWAGGRAGAEEAGLCVWSFVLSSGFSCNEYRPLRLESCFQPFMICRVRILLLGGPQGDTVGRFLLLWNLLFVISWAMKCCDPLYHCSAPDPAPSLNACQPPWADCHLHPCCLPSGVCAWPFTALSDSRAMLSARLHTAPVSVLPRSSPCCLLRYAYLQMCQCAHLSLVFVCGAWILVMTAVQCAVASRSGETWRSSYTTVLLTPLCET